MIVSFGDRGTEDVYDAIPSKAARRACPPPLVRIALRKLTMMNRATRLEELRYPRETGWRS